MILPNRNSREEGQGSPKRPRQPRPSDGMIPLVFNELRSLAARYLRHERPDHTLEPTELVHEAYIKLADQTHIDWQGRTHFFAVAASAVRQVLVDHARTHGRIKRGGNSRRITLFEGAASIEGPSVDLLALDEALDQLARLNSRQAQVVELRFFGGLTVEEIAKFLDLSPRTVKATWRVARAWLVQKVRTGESAS